MQPIQMTRSEYEKKYGIKPVFSTSTLDTTPTRVRMTREEYNQIYGSEKKNTVLENVNPLSQTNVNRITDIPSDIKESFSGIKEAGQTAAKSVSDVWKNKDLNVVQKSAATLPGILSGAANMAGTAALAPIKLLTTDEFEKNVAKKFAGAVESTMGANIPFVDKSMTEIYDSMSDDNKFIVSKLFAPVANVVTSVTTAGKAVPLAEQGVKTVAKNVPDVGATLKKASDNFSFRGEEKALRSVVDEIAKVEEKYAPIRKSNKFAKDVEGSRTRIAQSNVLSQAVDESGKINGEVASKLYKQMTIDDTEGLVRNLLKDENAVISIDSLKEVMENTILKSRLEGNDLVKALDSIEGELKGLSIRGDAAGNIPLYKVHDAKISATDGINYLSPATDKAYRKAIAKTYRQVVEKESKIEMEVDGKKAGIGDVNKQLSVYLDDIRRIKALDGRIVDRGKLGKYASSLAGTGIGMAVGSLGGPLAAAAGGAIGGKVASKITQTSMQNTFKKGVKGGVPENKILKAAKLRVADKPLLAPEGVLKTKAIKETENLIKKNVEMQKAAIKANDFTLVAKLKEIYASLVEKLKEQVRFVRENMKDQSGFAKVPFVKGNQKTPRDFIQSKAINPPNSANAISSTVPKLDAEVKSNIVNILDDYTLNKNPDLELQMDAAKIAEDLGIKLPKTYGALVKKLGEVLDEAEAPKTIKPQTTALLEEAKKYKSAEEFVKKQPLAYHGTTENLKKFDKRGTWFTDDYMNADGYASGENIYEGYLDLKNPLVIDGKGKKWDELDTPYGNSTQEIVGKVDQKKHDGVIFKNIKDNWIDDVEAQDPGTVMYAFNPQKSFLNESQLTDIWKKANETKPTLLEEAKKYKSAEAFVKAQPKFYHGGEKIESVSTRKSRFQNTFYFTESPDYAKSYGGKNSVVNEIYLDPSANLADLRNPSEELVNAIADKLNGKETGKIIKITRPDGTVLEIPEIKGSASNPVYTNKQILQGIVDGKSMFIELPEVKKILKEMGYDGLISTESKMGSNYGVWNADKVKTRKEMEDLWNKS